MTETFLALLAIVAAVLALTVVWRLASRRQSLPCPAWLAWMVELDNPFTRVNRAAVIVKLLDLSPGMTVLDFGCGPGRLTVPVARQVGPGGRVIAFDIQAGMLERAREKVHTAQLENVEFVHGAAGDGLLGHDRFDCALLVTVLGEIPDRAGAMKELYAALKPGGLLSVTELVFDPHFQRQSTLRKLAREAGFIERACFGNRIAYTMHLLKLGSE